MKAPRWTHDPDPWLIILVTWGVVGTAFTILIIYWENWGVGTYTLVSGAAATTWWGLTLAALSARRSGMAARDGRRERS